MQRHRALRATLVLALLPVFLPCPDLQAQEGTIAFTHSVKNDFELPEFAGRGAPPGGRTLRDMIPEHRVTQMVLFFDDVASLMVPVPDAQTPAGGEPGEVMIREGGVVVRQVVPGGRGGAEGAFMMQRLRQRSASRSAQETVVSAHTTLADGHVAETREFMGRKFRIETERPAYAWKLSGEQADFLGYVVQKATAVQDSTTIEAWFTPQIPVMGGPGPYGGLPGMILVVSVNDGETQYTATEVALREIADGVIVPPSEGEVVTPDRYEQIVEEKLEEMRMMNRRPRG
jgi:hypothetical protein